MFLIAIESTLTHGVGGMVLFASEVCVQSPASPVYIPDITVINSTRFCSLASATLSPSIFSPPTSCEEQVSTVERWHPLGRRRACGSSIWNSSQVCFVVGCCISLPHLLSPDFLKLSTYLLFFTVIVSYYGFPLSIIRDIYVTARSFINRLRALHRYQNATRNMDQKYPSATEEEMPSDRTCIICREEMVLSEPEANGQSHGPNTTPKKLPCGHIFHFYCLRSWLERQQSCPTWYVNLHPCIPSCSPSAI